jgi:SAM-dependent methyltransferase
VQLKNRCFDALLHAAYDRRLGIHTGTVCLDDDYARHLATLGVTAPGQRVGHYASQWLTLRRILDRDEVGPSDGFLDMGCGEGRVLVEAALGYRFGMITGVELSPTFADAARANLARIPLSADVEVVEADATSYAIPTTTTVIYLFNPFKGDIFDAFVRQVEDSLDRAPRRLRIIYRLPREGGKLLATGRFTRTRIGRSLLTGRERDDSLVMFETR